MPYKDPSKARKASRESMRKLRQERRQAAMSGSLGQGAELQPGSASVCRRSRASSQAQTSAHSPDRASGQEPQRRPALSLESLTKRTWGAELLRLGLVFVNQVEEVLRVSPRDAVALAQSGIALVSANWAHVVKEEVEGPQPGSVADLDSKYLLDQEYLDLAERLLARKSELQRLADNVRDGQRGPTIPTEAPPGGAF